MVFSNEQKASFISKLRFYARIAGIVKLYQLPKSRTYFYAQFKTDAVESRFEALKGSLIAQNPELADNINQSFTLKDGVLSIPSEMLQNAAISTRLNAFIEEGLVEADWYQKFDPNAQAVIELHQFLQSMAIDYGTDLKGLGVNGMNKAVDPVVLIQDEGALKILSIQRFDGSVALPGGMVENKNKVKGTCVDEILEECFSGSLFKDDQANPSSMAIDRVNIELSILQNTILDILKFTSENMPPVLFDGMKADLSSSQNIRLVLKNLDKIYGKDKIEHQRVQLKCELFKRLLPEKWALFHDSLDGKLTSLDFGDAIPCQNGFIPNLSDPRNTNSAVMFTKPFGGVFTRDYLIKLAENCALEYEAGDDASAVAFRDLCEFSPSVKMCYSDHLKIVLSTIAIKLESDDLVLTDGLMKQIDLIESTIRSEANRIPVMPEDAKDRNPRDVYLSREDLTQLRDDHSLTALTDASLIRNTNLPMQPPPNAFNHVT